MADETERKIEDSPASTAPPIAPLQGGPEPRAGAPTPGLSQSPGLRTLDSQVPGLPGGGLVNHVMGPGQSPVDPIAAGLDTSYDPMTRAENRLITQTGTLGSGNPPSTYLGRGGPPSVAVSDMTHIPAPPDVDAQKSPGPNSVGAGAPSVLEQSPVPVVKGDEPAAHEAHA